MTVAPPISSEHELDERLTAPTPALVGAIHSLASPLLILGAGGKMGPTLCVLAKRAAEIAKHPLEVIAVSRFKDERIKHWLESSGVRTLVCDLMEFESLRLLPDAPNILYLAGMKFGTSKDPSATWATNTIIPANVARRFPSSRIVALSTGNVYPFRDISAGGSRETDPLTPIGEYPNAAVARERLFEFFSHKHATPAAFIRLFYAVELRYGILVDIASRIISGEPIDLANGHFNCIWQGDANEMILRSFALASAPPSTWNLCIPEIYSVRSVAAELGELLGCAPLFKGDESPTALLGNPERICSALGRPATRLPDILRWTAQWVAQGGANHGKPTHFDVRDGVY